MSVDIFECQEGVHTIEPTDPEDPSGTDCRCGAIALIGVMAAVNNGHRTFLKFMIYTNPDDEPEATR